MYGANVSDVCGQFEFRANTQTLPGHLFAYKKVETKYFIGEEKGRNLKKAEVYSKFIYIPVHLPLITLLYHMWVGMDQDHHHLKKSSILLC